MNDSRNEVSMVLEKYGFFSGPIQAFASDAEVKKLIWYFRNGNLEPFEKPDAYIKVDNSILIIEHFAINGYEAFPDGGSKLQRNERQLDQKLEKLSEGQKAEYLTSQIGVTNSYQGFIDNCIARFSNHYQKIQSYKERLQEENIANDGTDFKVCFLMEDVSPLGTLTHDGERTRPVVLAQSEEFLDFYTEMNEVDWVISAIPDFPYGYSPYLLSHKYIPQCREQVLDYANYQFLEGNCMRTDIMGALNIPPQE